MNKVLFIGTFLSHITGSKSVSEKLQRDLSSSEISIVLVSRFKNKFLRFIDIIYAVTFQNYKKIHIDTFSGQAFYIAEVSTYIAKLRKKKIILTLRGGALPEFYSKNNKRIQKVFTRASLIQTPSLYLQDFFSKQKIQIDYLPNPINLERFPYNRNNVKENSLLWVRAFTSIYNPDLAVKTLLEIRKTHPNTTLTMIGPNKGLLSKTKKLINELKLENAITILGPIQNDKLYKYYQTHQVFLNTTSYESFGVAVVEAASCGIPIVSTKVGEIPYLWKHNENILMTDINPLKFAVEINKLLNSKKLHDKLSKNARKKAETFDWDNIKKEWIKILE